MTVMAASNALAETVGRLDEAPFVVDVGPVGATEHADGGTDDGDADDGDADDGDADDGDADDGDADDGDADDGDADVHSRRLWLAYQADD
jgi:hypothetical protein